MIIELLLGCAKSYYSNNWIPCEKWHSKILHFVWLLQYQIYFCFILKKNAFISCFTNLFICLLSSYVFPSLDYIFHSAPFCFASLLYCQFLKSAIARLEILHFSNIDCLVMSIFFISHIFFSNSRMSLKFLKELCYSHIMFSLQDAACVSKIDRIMCCALDLDACWQ